VCGGSGKPGKGRVALPPKSLLAVLEAAEDWQHKNNPLNPICILSKSVQQAFLLLFNSCIISRWWSGEGPVDFFQISACFISTQLNFITLYEIHYGFSTNNLVEENKF
jgi:hypothetical protein